jgi:ABC-2 type transport system ATP-binding protein
MIEVNSLKKIYEVKRREKFFSIKKEKIEAVKNISLRMEKGGIVGLLGINGAGKTTTIKMLTTLIEPTEGTYTFDGIDAIAHPDIVKRQINMIAGGERMIYWKLTAYENLWYYGQLYGIENNLLKKRIEELVKLVGIEGKADLPVETFSKGMKQRLQIARGMINDPKYIFLDEPTIGLDAIVTQELHKEIRRLAKEKEKGILLTSHYLSEVEELCDYIYLVNAGELVFEGTKKDLTDYVFSGNRYIFSVKGMDEAIVIKLRDYLRVIDFESEVEHLGGNAVISSKAELSSNIAAFAVNEGLVINELHKVEPSLEQAVIKLSQNIENKGIDIA